MVCKLRMVHIKGNKNPILGPTNNQCKCDKADYKLWGNFFSTHRKGRIQLRAWRGRSSVSQAHDCITNTLAVYSTFLGNKSGGCIVNTVACLEDHVHRVAVSGVGCLIKH